MTEIIAGLATGSIYAMVALGYNMTHLASGVLNFAHANIMVVGMFVAYWGYSSGDVPAWLVFVIAFLLAGLIGLVEEVVAIRPMRNVSGSSELVTMVGVATIITGALSFHFGTDSLRVPFFGPEQALLIFGERVRPLDLIVVAAVIAFAALLHFGTEKTRIGLAALAQTDDREAAQLRGVNIRSLSLWGFALAAAFGGLLGPLIVSKTFAATSIAIVLAVKGFVVLVLGGVGSHRGVLLAAFAIGLIEAFGARYIGPGYRDIVVFAVFCAVLLTFPQGLFGERRVRTV
ncbi:branched-chain amino acid ABC transporter permease [Actinomadura livida]|uniref:Branched-chain amino acid ABC transporter permease n=1 Tax=Actinomadura livida TaxID=79909 RepID=A0A7W7IFC4_9ACTN|nr:MULTISPECIES: branched-chain amino acid ABC transporter permease [Actinomadura]MBB4775945.1 branched-chain amino acid transport system permease protein [Actinomadura catellatispora]GGU16593.1 branched-chain amino acid ABC transporter permease [Actinomadura livida]